MILLWFLLIPFLGGLLAWTAGRWSVPAVRWISLGSLLLGLVLSAGFWMGSRGSIPAEPAGEWMVELNLTWIPRLGASFFLAMDGLSLLLVVLTFLLGVISVVVSWKGITEKVGFFHFNLLWVITGTVGVFVALDLFLFFFFWELMIVPMYFLIGIWGYENRNYAATKFFLFTQASGLLLLVSILGIYFIHGAQTGDYTFSYVSLLDASPSGRLGFWLMLGFFVAFTVKLPAFPFHTWLPDAHTQAPTAGSVILAGILLKTGAYGLLRFVLPLFPEASADFAFAAMLLGVIGILYGAMLAFAQTDFKRLVAYTSVSHMGFVLVGVYAWNQWALQGVVMQMICHGLSTGALFILAGILYERIHTRDMEVLGGLWKQVPRMAALGTFFAMASLGLPGLGNFIAEFLILFGAFQYHVPLTVLAALGLVAATVYSLWIVQQVFHGERKKEWVMADLSFRETTVLAVLVISLLGLGLYPRPVISTAEPVIQRVENVRPAAIPDRPVDLVKHTTEVNP